MSHYAFPLNTSPHEQSFAFWENGWSHDELKRVVALGESLPKEEGKTGGPTDADGTSPDYRACTLAWMNATPDTQWLFDKIGGQVRELNDKYFSFDLWGFESLQYTVYNGSARQEFYDWHTDTMGKGSTVQRKLSLVLQLDEPQDYEGGELWLHGKVKQCVKKERGLLYVFPSYTLHRVTPVTSGLRRTIVGWTLGPEFR